MGSFQFNVVAGTDINTNVGFAPLGVIVANYSPFYLYFPDALSYCPPWTAGVILPLAHATQARATWSQSPFDKQVITNPPANLVYTASLTFTDDPGLVLQSGTSIDTSSFISPKTVPLAIAGTPTGTTSFGTIPTNSRILAVYLSAAVYLVPNAIGQIGRVTVLIYDGVTSVELLGLMATPFGNQLSLVVPQAIQLPTLNPNAASWIPQINCFDETAALGYYVRGGIDYL